MIRKFDTKVQHLKYRVLREVAKRAWEGNLEESAFEIPKVIAPGREPTMRCCVYKERAVLGESVKIAMNTTMDGKGYKRVVQVIDIACDECPVGGYQVTNACRGCIAHRCGDVCPRDAITYDENQNAHIDKSKCIECGKCAQVCPYSAITHNVRPCQNACKVNAISMDENQAAYIDEEKCISCGACVYMCPFGAITDASFILDAIDLIQNSNNNKNYKVYALVAPSIASQFKYAKLGQVVTGLREMGFHNVVEVAMGADMVADAEARELVEKGFLTSSCCPAFVQFIKTRFPDMEQHISHNDSPMTTLSKALKEKDPDCKIVFIGPCTAKKVEFQQENIRPYVDCVITFEELQALFDSKDIDITALEEGHMFFASYFGRIFARSGGLTEAVQEAIKEQGVTDFEVRPVVCNGIAECKMALLKANKGMDIGNFIEGMACVGGCVNGAGCLTHSERNKLEVDKSGNEALGKSIANVIKILQ